MARRRACLAAAAAEDREDVVGDRSVRPEGAMEVVASISPRSDLHLFQLTPSSFLFSAQEDPCNFLSRSSLV